MEFTYENTVKWFDDYFKAFNKYAGDPETVPNMEKYFTPDLEFWSYNMPNITRPSTREDLLNTMIHPGLHEELTPQEYVIDERRKAVAVHLQLQFTEEPTGTVYPIKYASANYQLVFDENNDLKIKKIYYFTEHRPPDEPNMADLMRKYREKAQSG